MFRYYKNFTITVSNIILFFILENHTYYITLEKKITRKSIMHLHNIID